MFVGDQSLEVPLFAGLFPMADSTKKICRSLRKKLAARKRRSAWQPRDGNFSRNLQYGLGFIWIYPLVI